MFPEAGTTSRGTVPSAALFVPSEYEFRITVKHSPLFTDPAQQSFREGFV